MKDVFLAAASRYRPWNNFYYYARGKTALDPAYGEALRLLSESTLPLLDLGCGIGLLAASLREGGCRAPIVGLDVDPVKIETAQRVVGENTRFLVCDAREFPPHSGNVVMFDALHYFTDDEQQTLLQRVANSVAPGGLAVIRMGIHEQTWRFAFTWIEEWIVSASKWIPNQGWNFPTQEEVCRPFRKAGFSEQIRPAWGWTPFSSYLFVFRRESVPQAE